MFFVFLCVMVTHFILIGQGMVRNSHIRVRVMVIPATIMFCIRVMFRVIIRVSDWVMVRPSIVFIRATIPLVGPAFAAPLTRDGCHQCGPILRVTIFLSRVMFKPTNRLAIIG